MIDSGSRLFPGTTVARQRGTSLLRQVTVASTAHGKHPIFLREALAHGEVVPFSHLHK